MQKALATQGSELLQSSPGPAGLGVVVVGSAVVDAGVAVLAVGVFASIIYCKDNTISFFKIHVDFLSRKKKKEIDTNTDTHERLQTNKTTEVGKYNVIKDEQGETKKQAGVGEIVQRLQHKLTNKTYNNTYDTNLSSSLLLLLLCVYIFNARSDHDFIKS